MFGFGTQELIIILLIAFFVFGGKKLPEIGAGLGKGIRSFKEGLRDVETEIKKGDGEKLASATGKDGTSDSHD
jgi:sec-independent protein translocase protein TatA